MAQFVERALDVRCHERRVPATVWVPAGATPPLALVLVGHGGGGHKRDATVVAMAEGLVREHSLATLAIDGPVNGDRTANDDDARALRRADRHAYRRKFYAEKYDEMVEDWRAALDAAQALPEIGRGPVGYSGLSMGTRFGVPLIASTGEILLGLMHCSGTRLRFHRLTLSPTRWGAFTG